MHDVREITTPAIDASAMREHGTTPAYPCFHNTAVRLDDEAIREILHPVSVSREHLVWIHHLARSTCPAFSRAVTGNSIIDTSRRCCRYVICISCNGSGYTAFDFRHDPIVALQITEKLLSAVSYFR